MLIDDNELLENITIEDVKYFVDKLYQFTKKDNWIIKDKHEIILIDDIYKTYRIINWIEFQENYKLPQELYISQEEFFEVLSNKKTLQKSMTLYERMLLGEEYFFNFINFKNKKFNN